jgi:hypothetical protein
MKVMLLALMIVVASLTATAAPSSTAEPKRENGLSVFMFPKRAADLDATKTVKWGFVVSERDDHSRPVDRPTFKTAEDLLAFYRSRPSRVQQNGLWVVVTHPDAYSPEEKVILEHLKSLCVEQAVPLFVSRAAELPNGWKRVS